jgi:hypothetical protein
MPRYDSSILQRWKRALHVPLRLDVYYQHPDQRRELLERWCLEYAPVQQQQFEYSQHQFSNDPIVQLRHVCKKIVIWLRTLYCWSRMLPSQALRGTTIGFSIYVVSEGNDDVTSLVSNQQFRVQGGGGGAAGVSTPYGQLGWKVFYAPPPAIERLIPRPTPYHATPSNSNNTSNGAGGVAPHAMPIAIPGQQQQYQPQQHLQQQQQQQLYQQHQFEPYTRRDSSPTPATVQSAPNHNRQMMYHRSHSAAEGIRMSPDATTSHNVLLGGGGGGSGGKPATLFAPRSHNSRGIVMATTAGRGGGQQQQLYHQLQPPQQQQPFLPGTPTPGTPGSSNNNGPPPSKTLSGLSLAMMMSDDNVDATGAAGNEDSNNNNNNADGGAGTTNSQQAEKRRAALHHAPPQLFLQQNTNGVPSSPLVRKSSTGDYGYAYNSHIPSLRPMEQHQQQQQQQQYNNYNNSFNYSSGAVIDRTTSASPSMGGGGGPLGSTPPGYLGATPPHKAGYLTGATPPTMMFMNQNRDSLIPPRSAVTPPFVRPLGFMVDNNNNLTSHNNNPSSPSMTMGAAVDSSVTPHTVSSAATTLQMQTTPSSKLHPTTSTPSHHPVTSLDLLHSSPFQHPPNGSLLSSLSVHDPSYMNSVLSGDFRLQAAAEAAVYGAGGAGDDPFHHASLFGYHHHRHSSSFLDEHYHQHHHNSAGGGGAEEMPFAVEDASPPAFSSASGFAGGSASGTSHLASSAAVASFAQRCSTASRLALFDSVAQQQQQSQQPFHGSSATSAHDGMSLYHDMAVSSITDQLAEFKMFGASLMMNSNRTGGGVGPTPLGVPENKVNVGEPSAASNSTPISLRT